MKSINQASQIGQKAAEQQVVADSPTQPESDQSPQDEDDTENSEDFACSWYQNCQPQACQCFARPSCLLVWLCLSSFTQGLVVNGFVNSVLTTLELRYDLSSSESGLIASMYDIGSVLCLVPVTYIGHRYRRSRLISIGLLIMSVGSFVFTIPQFSTDAYNYESPVSPLCYLTGKTYPNFCNKQTLNNYKFVFWFGQFLHGVGASPLYTLAVAYLDDNLTIQQSGAFLGAYYTMSMIGPAMGYLLGGIFLNIFVEPGITPTDISPRNRNLWVGGWWIGFLLSGLLSLVAVVPLFGFPKRFPGADKTQSAKKLETHRGHNAENVEMKLNFTDAWKACIALLKNPTFLFLSFAGATQNILLTGLSTFGPKMLQILFFFTASSSTLSLGISIVPAAALGVIGGGIFLRYTEVSVLGLLRLSATTSAIGVIFGLGLLAKCDVQKFAGINRDYTLTPNQHNSLNATCNMNCNCQESKFMYSPLCGADSIIYYSPCYAGCQNNDTLIDGTKYYQNCSCISGSISLSGGRKFSAVEGTCTDQSCRIVTVFFCMIFMFVFLLSSTVIPILQCTMRVIPARLKDFGLGLQWVIFRLLGSIPGPLVLGKLIDSTCSLWTGGCGHQGSCSFYNGQSFWVMVLVFVGVAKLLEIATLSLAAFLYVKPDGTEDGSI